MSTKSAKRTEAKKRKAAAFLQLVQSEESEEKIKQPVTPENCGVSSTKKIKTGTGTQNGSQDDKNETHSKPETSSERSGNSDSRMSDEMFAEYKRVMREKQKQSMQKPKIFLTLDELTRDFPNERVTDGVKDVPPLFITDIQNLLLYSLQGNIASCKPRLFGY